MGLRERGLMDHMINIYLTRVNPSRSYDVPRGTQTPFGRRNPNLGFLSTHEHLHVRHECDSLREYSWDHFLSFCVSLTTLLPRDTVENSCKEPGYRKRPKRCFVSTNPESGYACGSGSFIKPSPYIVTLQLFWLFAALRRIVGFV
ncbi:hypothetical protein pdam_00008242 [Pocillopora damicornis]|uniref:Uncharacterized protein n=1 Tax=Pocillopora damicornis TaxID=46731 RepID=A0A3M6UUV6_POCDA|nr:hypothetical protein pdam_00008242 [Pocillopora damicornis]